MRITYQPDKKKILGLLPNYFKRIGLVIMVLAFLGGVILAVSVEWTKEHNEILKILSGNIFILGLLFIALSKDKIEDEQTLFIRLQSMAGAFVWAIIYVIVNPIIDFITSQSIGEMKARSLVSSMLFVYLIIYFVKKSGR